MYVNLFVVEMKVKFKKFSSRARLPTLAAPGSACFDVCSSRCVTLEPGVTRSIETDLGTKFAKKYVARICPRSGLSMKGLFLGGGVIDSEYRGNISIILTNLCQRTFEIEIGDRIAQLMFFKKEEVDFVEVDEYDDKTYCYTKGFDSTGLTPTEI